MQQPSKSQQKMYTKSISRIVRARKQMKVKTIHVNIAKYNWKKYN